MASKRPEFLSGVELRPVELDGSEDIVPLGLAIGQGSQGAEVVVARSDIRNTATGLRRTWTSRHGGRAAPLLLVVLHDGTATVCGPAGDPPPLYRDLAADQVESICRSVLEAPNRHAALAFLRDALPEAGTPIPGMRNSGLLATHELEVGVPRRSDWPDATARAQQLKDQAGRPLLEGMGYELEPLAGPAHILRANGSRQAVAVLLERDEAFDLKSQRFSRHSPVSYALAQAEEHRLPWVIVVQGQTLRLHPVGTGVGVASRGRTETYVQLRLNLVREDQAGYLWLLFSPDALEEGGTLEAILASSEIYAADLSGRLRQRVYDDVVPNLAEAIAAARHLDNPDQKDLAQTYEMALLLLFRLLFVGYAEDQRLLPYETNESYKRRSLKEKARELQRLVSADESFGEGATHWREVMAVFEAIREGNPEWGVPLYNGTLFSTDPELSVAGAKLEEIELSNREFGPALRCLLLDKGPEGLGPIDFRSLGVREFGTIYEGLLESELSVASQPLTVDRDGNYVPASKDDEVLVEEGQVYPHNTSGRRKSTGTYYTKTFAVEHLLAEALEPALEEHLAALEKLDDTDATERFFDFRVADIAMGSGHFLTASLDLIEKHLSDYLVGRRLPGIQNELERLRRKALESLPQMGEGIEIDDSQLLRRQIARRCIYGVDINPIAVHLARLAVWVHTFVPGLPLSFLDHGLVQGNSLLGIASLDEAKEALELVEEQGTLWDPQSLDLFHRAEEALDRLGRLSDADAAEVREAREAQHRLTEREAPVAALFDILTAARLDDHLRAKVQQGAALRWAGRPESLLGSEHHRLALSVLSPLTPFHFPIQFPEVFRGDRLGFDVIVGNPPWEEATVEEDQFWTRYWPGFKNLTREGQQALKERLREDRPDLVRQHEEQRAEAELLRRVLASGAYPGMGTGDPDLYKAFAWRFWELTREGGHLGVVLPRSIFATKGSAPWREETLLGSEAHIVLCKNKDEWLFTDVNPGYSIALVGMQHLRVGEPTLEIYGTFTSQEEMETRSSSAHLDTLRLKQVDPLVCVPALESGAEFELFDRLIDHPSFGDETRTDWRARPTTELHATNDSHFFSSDGEPVFNHLNIGHFAFDESAGVFARADFAEVSEYLQEKRVRSSRNRRSAFSEMPRDWISDSETLPCRHPRVAFRDVVHASNPRKVWAAVVPARSLLTNAAPYLLFPRGGLREQAYVVGMLNSSVCDWIGHLRVVLHLNYFILNSLPVPLLARGPRCDRLIELAASLALSDGEALEDWNSLGRVGLVANRQAAIAEVDALASLIYGLEERQLSLIWSEDGESTRPPLGMVREYRDQWRHTE